MTRRRGDAAAGREAARGDIRVSSVRALADVVC